MKPQPEVLTPPEAAEFLRISKATLYRLLAVGRLPFVRLSGHGLRGALRFRREALIKWMEREERKQVVKPICSICLLAHEFGERCQIIGKAER